MQAAPGLALLAALAIATAPAAAAQAPRLGAVPGKEYSNAQDETALGLPDPLQNIQWDNPLAPVDTFDYSGSGPPPEDPDQVDALANHQDFLFHQLIAGAVPLVLSFETVAVPFFQGDDIWFHTPGGLRGLWALGPLDINVPVPPDDVDGLELWGTTDVVVQHDPWFGMPPPPGVTDDANHFSYVGDCIVPGPPAPPGTPAVSVFFFVPNPVPGMPGASAIYITHDELRNALVAQSLADPDLPDIEPDRPIDVDGLMVFDALGNGVWEDGDTIVFSLWPTASTVLVCGGVVPPSPFDGGEIWVWTRGALPTFLVHGGVTWDTPNAVGALFGVPTENIDALEAVLDAWPSFCDASDGSLASCPCAPGNPDSGCDIAQGTGGVRLDVLVQQTSPNGATLQGTGYPVVAAPTAIVIRSSSLDPGTPVVFGDGLRCVNTFPLVRLAAATASGGTSTHAFGHSGAAGPGTFYYQIWFRNTPSSYCDPAAAFNLSNGRSMIW
jgi:hypothetical protein